MAQPGAELRSGGDVGIRLESYLALALVKADVELVKNIQASKQVKSNAETRTKADPGMDSMRSDLDWDAMEENRNQRSIAHLHINRSAFFKIEPDITGQVSMDDRVGRTGVHVEIRR